MKLQRDGDTFTIESDYPGQADLLEALLTTILLTISPVEAEGGRPSAKLTMSIEVQPVGQITPHMLMKYRNL